MNEFKTDINGKLPVVLDDIRFLDSIFREGILSIIKGMNNRQNFILSGITVDYISGDNFDANGGAIYYNNELLLVQNASLVVPSGNKVVIKRTELFDPKGLKLFGDGTAHNTYKIIKGEFLVVLEDNTDYFEVDTIRFNDIYKANFSENTAFNKNFGTAGNQVAVGNHSHFQAYEPKANNPNQLIKKVIDIGVWDMQTTGLKGVLHGFTSEESVRRIVSIDIIIFADTGILSYPLNFSSNTAGTDYGNWYVANNYIYMKRASGGFFDSVTFSSNTINRGYALVQYIPDSGGLPS